jgi:hypothetical protein
VLLDGYFIDLQSVSISINSISLLTISGHFSNSSFMLFKLGKIAFNFPLTFPMLSVLL